MPEAFPFPQTFSASPSSFCRVVGVRFVVGMTLWAMRPATIERRRAAKVFVIGHRLKMCWTVFIGNRFNTCNDTTKMIGLQSLWNRTNKKFAGIAMCSHRSPLKPKPPVAVLVRTPRPNPTWTKFGSVVRDRSVLIDLRPESSNIVSYDVCNEKWVAVDIPALVMFPAPPMRFVRILAALNRACTLGHVGQPFCLATPPVASTARGLSIPSLVRLEAL